MGATLRGHWPEYLIEAAGLGLFMISACLFGTLLGHPDSPLVGALPGAFARRVLMGCAMGLTAIALIYSPWGQRSGAHFNPATTLSFWRLGKVATADAAFYGGAQAIGGLGGVLIAAAIVGERLGHPSVRYVVTEPGPGGPAAAFVAESLIAFVLMTMVLHVSNTARLARFTGLCAGILVAIYIAIEAPVSGMSLNPARSLASAIPARSWTALWVYFTAPPLGMLAAAQAYVALCRRANVFCAKLHHGHAQRCIFRCRHAEMFAAERSVEPTPEAAAVGPSA